MTIFTASIRRPDLEPVPEMVTDWLGEGWQVLAEVGGVRPETEYDDYCGHRRGCSCEADDLAFFADEDYS